MRTILRELEVVCVYPALLPRSPLVMQTTS